MTSTPKALLGMTPAQMEAVCAAQGEPGYRARQLFHAVYRERVATLDEITTLPKEMRCGLAASGYFVGGPAIEKRFVSADKTVRYLMGFADGQSVETVWMPEGDRGESGDGSEAGEEEAPSPGKKEYDRATICVSSQAGCAVGCQFCLTAKLGLLRNLTAGEIVGQVTTVLNDHRVDLDAERINLVFMGQGEPFHNYDAFIAAVRLLVEGVGIPESRMTVSTSGIVPRIADLGKEPVRPKLAISLNASNDATRAAIMPINRKWDIAALGEAAAAFPLRNREKLTFEYVLLAGVNDSAENANEVAAIVRGLRAKVNLIAWNAGPDTPFQTPSDERVRTFQKTLIDAGVPAYIRRPRGRDIFAACGQLKRTVA